MLLQGIDLTFELTDGTSQAVIFTDPQGDLFVASQHHEQQSLGSSLRILVRCGTTQTDEVDTSGVSPIRHSLRLAMAEWVVKDQGGHYALDSASSDWLVIVVDLPAP